jgi:hypothetical protein
VSKGGEKSREKSARRGQWTDVYGGMAFIIPVALINHPNLIRCGPHTIKLLIDLGRQYSGLNNGYLCPAWELMRKCGWRSRETLAVAMAEAEHYGLIQKTRQGGRNSANLYAVTWWRIHALQDKPLNVNPTAAPSNDWLKTRPDFETPEWLIKSRERRKNRGAAKFPLHAQRAA